MVSLFLKNPGNVPTSKVRGIIEGRGRQSVKSWPAYLYKLLKNGFVKAKDARFTASQRRGGGPGWMFPKIGIFGSGANGGWLVVGCHGPRFTYLIRDGEGGQREEEVRGPGEKVHREIHGGLPAACR
eukprot:symbB.v1.2.031456.t1/scaffold3645.1/size52754/2